MKKLTVLTALAGCKEQTAQKPPVDQSRIYIYSNDEEARKCVNGELSFFNPIRWGNEQFPLFAVAQYRDTNYNITYNNADVVCVFTDKRVQKPASGSESSVSGSVSAK